MDLSGQARNRLSEHLAGQRFEPTNAQARDLAGQLADEGNLFLRCSMAVGCTVAVWVSGGPPLRIDSQQEACAPPRLDENRCYLRAEQAEGNIVWTSPIWGDFEGESD